MQNNKKFLKKSFWVFQYEEETEFLSKMREQGWKFAALHKGIPTTYEFDACEPEKYTYQLDFIPYQEDQEDYHQLMKDAGWEEIMPWQGIGGQWYYYCRKSETGQEKLYTDIDSKIELMKKISKKVLFFLLVAMLLEVNGIYSCMSIVQHDAGAIITGIMIFLIAFFSAAVVFLIWQIVCIIRKRIQLAKIKAGRDL